MIVRGQRVNISDSPGGRGQGLISDSPGGRGQGLISDSQGLISVIVQGAEDKG